MRVIKKKMNSSSYLRVLPTTTIVLPILLQWPINKFAVCKHCSVALTEDEKNTKFSWKRQAIILKSGWMVSIILRQ